MISEFEQALDEFSKAVSSESPYAVIGLRHFCVGFSNMMVAEDLKEECRDLRLRKKCYIREQGFCDVDITAEAFKRFPEVIQPDAKKETYPLGSMDGRIYNGVKVVFPLETP